MPAQVLNPRIRGFICTTAHPDGCAANVRAARSFVAAQLPGKGLGNVLVLGSSTGFGFASTLCACFGYGAKTLGVCFERPADERRPATAGWYNLAEAHRLAKAEGRHLETINADAFAHATRAQVIETLRARFGKLNAVVYSLASPKRKDPNSDTVYSSVLKPLGSTFTGKTVDLDKDAVTDITIEPATPEEAANTVKVMGGEDWELWIKALLEADLLAPGCRTVAYSYIGPQVTYPIYRSGTIGSAKEHLEATGKVLNALLAQRVGGNAWVSVNKALVTQASSAIPVVPLYISILFAVMKRAGTHEDTTEQIVRLFKDHIGPGKTPKLDEAGRIRIDDLEMAPAIQAEVSQLWNKVTTENLKQITDYASFQQRFRQLFGFEVPGVDYSAATEIMRPLV